MDIGFNRKDPLAKEISSLRKFLDDCIPANVKTAREEMRTIRHKRGEVRTQYDKACAAFRDSTAGANPNPGQSLTAEMQRLEGELVVLERTVAQARYRYSQEVQKWRGTFYKESAPLIAPAYEEIERVILSLERAEIMFDLFDSFTTSNLTDGIGLGFVPPSLAKPIQQLRVRLEAFIKARRK